MTSTTARPSTAAQLNARARAVMPGGNTRHTVFQAPFPPYASLGSGAFLESTDGDRWLDFVNNMTSLIHGHADPDVTRAAVAAVQRGASYSLPTESEVDLAELIAGRVASVDHVRFTNSGSEAVALAIRTAQAYTGRPKIAKFEGCYHGTHDLIVPSTVSGPEAWGSDDPPTWPNHVNTPAYVLENTVVLRYNDLASVDRGLAKHGRDLAAVIVDPMPARSGLIRGTPEFLAGLRARCSAAGVLLIFDEVISYRVAPGGAQSLAGVSPDLTTFGKIIGGGFPVGAVGGRADIMALFDPTAPGGPKVPHGGTFNANPVTMAAGSAALRKLTPAAYDRLDRLGESIREGLRQAFAAAGVPAQVMGMGSLFCVLFHDRPVREFRDAVERPEETRRRERLQTYLRGNGILLHQNLFGCASTAMAAADVATLLDVVAAGLGRP